MRKILLAILPLLAAVPVFADVNPKVKNGGPHPQVICAETRKGWGNVNIATPYGIKPFTSGNFSYIENDNSNIIVAATHFDLPAGYQPNQPYSYFVPVFYTRIGWGGFYYITPGSSVQTLVSNASAGLLRNDGLDIISTATVPTPISSPIYPVQYIAFMRGGWSNVFLSSPIGSYGQSTTYEFRSPLLSNILPDQYNHMLIYQQPGSGDISIAIWRNGWVQAIWFTAPAMSQNTWGYSTFSNSGIWGPIPIP